MDNFELTAWLGPAEATDEQREALLRASERIDARYPGEDAGESRWHAFTTAAQIILGDSSLESIAADYHRARAAERSAYDALTGALISLADSREIDLVKVTGLARMTVRKALGK